MTIELLLIIGLIVLMGLILGFMYIKDKEVNTKLERLSSLIDPLQKSVFDFKNALNAIKIQVSQTNTKQDINIIQTTLENKIEQMIEEIEKNLTSSIVYNKDTIDSFMSSTNENIRLFKEKTKDFGRINDVVTSSGREDEIITLHKEGKNENEIAKILRLGIGEVELILKLAGVL